eukprot:6209467-Pleurochrysis_carterae.AAC.2
MFRVLRERRSCRAALDEVLSPYGELIIGGKDFETSLWDLRKMLQSVITTAASHSNLRPLDPRNPWRARRRSQLCFDGMGWTRGHGCVRLVVRSLDLTKQFTGPLFSRDSLFYLGNDKHADLSANFSVGNKHSIHAVLEESMVAKRISTPLGPSVSCGIQCSNYMLLPSEDSETNDEHDLFAGGDMAAANSGWALDSPVARYGCCLYCPLSKPNWFDSEKCASA